MIPSFWVKSLRGLRQFSADCSAFDETIFHHEGTKNELKTNNHKEHKELKGRETRKIKFLRSSDIAQALRLHHPRRDGYSRPILCALCTTIPECLRGARKCFDAPKPRGRVAIPPYKFLFFFAYFAFFAVK